MKILHIVRQFYPSVGGVQNVVLSLAKNQIKKGNRVSVLTLNIDFKDNKVLPPEERCEDISIRRISFFGSKRYPVALSCLKYIKDIDIVHIHCVDFFVDYLVLTKFIHKKKIVLHTHGGFFHTRWLSIFKRAYFNTITRLILRGCDKVIAVSKQDFDLFSKVTNNLVLINNGVEIEKYNALCKNIEFNMLLFVGRIDEHKGIDKLIRVIALLKETGVNVNLKIAGSAWKGTLSRLKYLANELMLQKYVIFLGQSSNDSLLEEMSKARIFVSASEYEGFGISAVEAMASGTICVLNDIPAFRELVEDKKTGFIVNYKDIQAAAKTIEYALGMNDNEYLSMANNAQIAVKKYSWDLAARKVFSVYEKILSEN